ncbi:hypothetical protein RHGRI_001236 [Rhododendron griersonianum]|uniref:Phosphoinositide phospholipase C n=1 Tax=Rhododendron griersonianum TaxID=479676 RepID=A0AAV6LKD3_9ERIC|nr:hypothetical protein RHGRI_001236 [Rhododendron griersonianum]
MVTRSAFVASKTILLVNSAKSAMLFGILFSKFDSQTRLHHVDCSRSLVFPSNVSVSNCMYWYSLYEINHLVVSSVVRKLGRDVLRRMDGFGPFIFAVPMLLRLATPFFIRPDVKEAFKTYAKGGAQMTASSAMDGATATDAKRILVHHDMSVPLSHYFIYTEHNSYLTGNQLRSACSDVPIIKAWKRGVRVIELDIWPKSTKDDVHVLHGRSWRKYPVAAILEFLARDLDNSCGTHYMFEIDQRACFCCISKPGRPSHTRSLGQRSSEGKGEDLWGKELSNLTVDQENDKSDNGNSNHNLDDEDNDNCDKSLHAFEPPVYKRLIAIRAGKPKGGLKELGEMDMSKILLSKVSILVRGVEFDALVRCTRLARLWDLYAVTSCPSRFNNTNPTMRLLNEYFGLLVMVSRNASTSSIEDGSFTLSNEWWKISAVNSTYTMCPTYPFALLVPECISDEEMLQAC